MIIDRAFRILSLISLMAACAIPRAAASPHGSHWIVPGRAVGQTALGPDGAKTLARLPRPDAADSGMSQTRAVWVSKTTNGAANTLFIHTVSNGALDKQPAGGVTIDTIRVTSPWYRTHGGVAAGATLARIRRQFPSLRPIDRSRVLFDAKARGIAFEFAHAPTAATPCIAIIVHPCGDTHVADAGQVAALLKEESRAPK